MRVELSLCSSTAEPQNTVWGRTGPGAAEVIPAFQGFAQSTPVPEAQLQQEMLLSVGITFP